MLLTVCSGPQCLAPRAHRVPVYPKVFPHSYMPLSRRTWLGCQAIASGPLWWGHTSPNGRGSCVPTIRPPGGTEEGTGFARAISSCHPPSPSRGLCWGALRVRKVAVLALQAPASPSTGCARRPVSASSPPPTRRRPRPRAPAANPTRLPLAAGGASAPVCPQGAPRRHKPQPGQAERESSGLAGSSCQGQALRVARKKHARQP